jgi:hypothetical protein
MVTSGGATRAVARGSSHRAPAMTDGARTQASDDNARTSSHTAALLARKTSMMKAGRIAVIATSKL